MSRSRKTVPGRGGDDVKLAGIAAQSFLDVHAPVVAERGNEFAVRRVDGVEILSGGVEDAPVAAVRPINHAAIDAERLMITAAVERVEAPELLAGGRVHREQHQFRRRTVNHAVNDDGTALNLRTTIRSGAPGVVSPRDFQLADIFGVDLFKRRIMTALVVAEIARPVGGLSGNAGRNQSQINAEVQRARRFAEEGLEVPNLET